MKYLLFSDIHGCLPALQRALDFFEAQKCDMMCILGDIINYGPRNRIPEGIDPKGIVERLNNLADKIIAVRGNCDAEVDQMLLDFPIMETYALLWMVESAICSPMVIYIIRRTCPRVLMMPSSMVTSISGSSRAMPRVRPSAIRAVSPSPREAIPLHLPLSRMASLLCTTSIPLRS